MHIPDWDEGFLADYDPAQAINAAVDAGAKGLMIYFQAHTGLCYWPTANGEQHRAFRGRDLVAESLDAARDAGVPVCAYYSVNFNNWAYLKHPDWRLEPIAAGVIGGGLLQRPRYGLCCLNNADYREFVNCQIHEIVTNYAIDTLFCDMVWWMSLCGCPCCHERYRAETGQSIPQVIDWLDPEWCRFQAARERWITELAVDLRHRARQARPELEVYHNFALGLTNWTRGVSFESATGHDFLGGDFYGGLEEQLVISRLMLNLSEKRPVEFMTTVASNLAQHEQLKSSDTLQIQNLAATTMGSAYMMIAAVDPRGTINPAMFERCRSAFARSRVYEPFLGGEPVEDIAVYFSSASKMSFSDNGKPLSEAPTDTSMNYPHFNSVRGACRALQRAHLPFGVITRKQIGELGRYTAVVLPNALRLDEEEVEAFRHYVAEGGRLYASCYSSLTDTKGKRHGDFMLADVFGCHFEDPEAGLMVHLEPDDSGCRRAIDDARYLSHWVGPTAQPNALRLSTELSGCRLMKLNLPYGYPSYGSAEGKDWGSIHSSPPWLSTDHPVVVRHEYGEGQCIYSAVNLEAGGSDAHEALFLHLVGADEPGAWSFASDAHPRVWMTAFDQPDEGRWIISFLNYTTDYPAIAPGPINFSLTGPADRRFVSLTVLPDKRELDFSTHGAAVNATVSPRDDLTMVAAYYARKRP
jgi:hypothetical protein